MPTLTRVSDRPKPKSPRIPPDHRTERRSLSAGLLFVDESVQRDERPAHLKKLTTHWKKYMCDPLHVSARKVRNGKYRYAIMDGRHRYAAGIANGETHFECVIHFDLTLEDEANFHLWEQSARSDDTAYDKWKLKIKGGAPEYVKANKLIEKMGLVVSTSPGNESIAGAGALSRVVDDYGADVLIEALQAAEAAFGRDKSTWQSNIIRGFGECLGAQPGVADSPEALGRKTARKYGTPELLVNTARARQKGYAGGGGEGMATQVAYLIAEKWNDRRKANQPKYVFAVPSLARAEDFENDDED